MNSAIHNTLQQYLDTFMETVSERFGVSRDELNDLWKETQKKKFHKKNKSSKRKKSSVPSAYILFCQDERAKIKAQNPLMTFPEVAKELGKRWNKANTQTKEHYQKQHAILLEQHQQQQPAPIEEARNTTITEEASVSAPTLEPEEEEEKPKKTKKPKITPQLVAPEDITNERERDLWPEFAKLTVAELRTQCDHNNIKKSKNRNDMIHALVIHRITLEDGNTNLDSEDEN